MCGPQMIQQLDHLEHMTEQALTHVSTLRADLRQKIPLYVNERLYLSSAGTQINLIPQSHNLEMITQMIAYCSAPAGGTLQIGVDRVISLPQGITRWDNLTWQLKETDIRQLTQGTAGAMFLELMGYEMPDKGPW